MKTTTLALGPALLALNPSTHGSRRRAEHHAAGATPTTKDTMTNREIIRELYRRFAARDQAGIRALLDPEIEWIQMTGFPGGGRHVGPDAVFAKVFAQLAERWSTWRAITEEYLDAGASIVVFGHYDGTFAATGKTMSAAFAHRYVLRDGVVIRFEQYADTRQVVEAMTNG